MGCTKMTTLISLQMFTHDWSTQYPLVRLEVGPRSVTTERASHSQWRVSLAQLLSQALHPAWGIHPASSYRKHIPMTLCVYHRRPMLLMARVRLIFALYELAGPAEIRWLFHLQPPPRRLNLLVFASVNLMARVLLRLHSALSPKHAMRLRRFISRCLGLPSGVALGIPHA